MNLKEKIQYSIELIKRGSSLSKALNPNGYFVGFSGGKDSQVLLDLIKRAGVEYHAYYSVTTNDPPENVYFIRNNYPDVTFIHPKDNFFKLIEKKGLPTIFHRFCCDILKENGGAGNVVLTGVRAEESTKRSKYNEVAVKSKRKEHADRSRKHTINQIEENEHRCIKGKDSVMIYPILKWTETEVWQYIKENNLPVNPCYKRGGRVGCMFCPFAKKQDIEYYEKTYPKFKEHIIKSLEQYLTRYPRNDNRRAFQNAQTYYDWWKSKRSSKKYLAEIQQYKLQF